MKPLDILMTPSQKLKALRDRHRQPSGLVPLIWNLSATVLVVGFAIRS